MSVEHEGFISVDIETAGPIPGVCSLLSIGACVIDRPAERFYIEVQPLNLHYEPEALVVTGFNLQTQIARGIDPKEAMQQFAHWVTSVTNARSKPILSVSMRRSTGHSSITTFTFISAITRLALPPSISRLCTWAPPAATGRTPAPAVSTPD